MTKNEKEMSTHAEEIVNHLDVNFQDEMRARMADALAAKKIEIAQQVYVKSTN